ncbi:MAG: hypothetical protein ACRD6I_15400 [Candidatus Acidiferrales bacterium]
MKKTIEASGTIVDTSVTESALPPMGARRILILGGIALILAGMIFGEVFAMFILHPNAARIGQNLMGATEAVAAGNSAAVVEHFTRIGGYLENRGTKVDTHVHIIVFGYIALLLAIVQPYVAWSERAKVRLALLFVLGATLLPVCVFLIHYVGLAFSPLASIGWASILADLGGLLVIIACAGELAGLWRHLRGNGEAVSAAQLLPERSNTTRLLLAGGTLLILAGFLHGAWYAGFKLYDIYEQDTAILRDAMLHASSGHSDAARDSVVAYGGLQAERAVNIAAHAHIIEFGTLAMLLAFVQPWVFLSERWKRRWAMVLLAGSAILPVFVLAELWWGLVAGGIADTGGLLVIIALTAMLIGVLRYTGRLDASSTGFQPVRLNGENN